MKNVGIIGLGYVGLTFGMVAAIKKYNVYGIEVSPIIRESLRNKKAHFFEPGLNNLISQHINKNFFLVDHFEPSHNLDAIIVTVGTPLQKGKKQPNFEYIQSALDAIKNIYTGKELIILRSTVSVGTTRNVVVPYLAKLCGKDKKDIRVAFCPERTIEGKAIRELQELPQVIGGNGPESLALAEELFREITPTIIRVDSLEAAELIKLFNNTYRDIHFALGNVFNEIAQSFGLDGSHLIKAANMGYSRSNIPMPGFVGGPCLEKDAYILTNNMKDSEGKNFVIQARLFNESQEDKVVNWVSQIIRKHGVQKKVAISGLAFKGTPDTSDLRGSNSVNIAAKLKAQGFEVGLHDFLADPEEITGLKIGKVFTDIYELADKSCVLLILNNNNRYTNLQLEKLNQKMGNPKVVLDAWGTIDHFESQDEGLKIYNFGNMHLQEI